MKKEPDFNYAAFIAEKYPKFLLDLNLCNPYSVTLSKEQLSKMLSTILNQLPSYASIYPVIPIKFQTSAIEDESCIDSNQTFTIYLCNPFSSNPIVSYKAVVLESEIKLECIQLRSPAELRKSSLGIETQTFEMPPIDPNKKTILIVDDDPILHRVMRNWLASKFNLIVLEDGRQAVNYIKLDYTCDLILMDMHMPNLNGYVASTLIREYEKNNEKTAIPIIAMSAGKFVDAQLVQCGFIHTFVKPLKQASILEYIGTNDNFLPKIRNTQTSETDLMKVTDNPKSLDDITKSIDNVQINSPALKMDSYNKDIESRVGDGNDNNLSLTDYNEPDPNDNNICSM